VISSNRLIPINRCPQAWRAASAGATTSRAHSQCKWWSSGQERLGCQLGRKRRPYQCHAFSDSSPAWTQVKPATCTRKYTRTHSSMQMRRGPDLLIKLSWVSSPINVVCNLLLMHRISESPSFNDLINSSIKELFHDVIILGSAYSKFVFPAVSLPLSSPLSLHISLSALLPLGPLAVFFAPAAPLLVFSQMLPPPHMKILMKIFKSYTHTWNF